MVIIKLHSKSILWRKSKSILISQLLGKISPLEVFVLSNFYKHVYYTYLILKLSYQSNKRTRLHFHANVTPEINFKDPTALSAFLPPPLTYSIIFNGKSASKCFKSFMKIFYQITRKLTKRSMPFPAVLERQTK